MRIYLSKLRQFIATICLVLLVTTTTACSSSTTATVPDSSVLSTTQRAAYSQLEQGQRGNSAVGQQFGDWVVKTSQGLVQDSFVRDNNKLGVVISSRVQPTEVKALARSLAMGFHKNFPNQDLTVLMYAPDKKKVLTAKYDARSGQVKYEA